MKSRNEHDGAFNSRGSLGRIAREERKETRKDGRKEGRKDERGQRQCMAARALRVS